MTARQALLLGLLVSLVATAQSVCILNTIDLGILCIIPTLCSITSLISSSQCRGDSLLSLQLTSGSLNLDINTDIIGLSVSAGSGASVKLNLGSISINTDLNITGPAVVIVAAGATLQIGGNVAVLPGATLRIGGNVVVGGLTSISGILDLTGSTSSGSVQSAWLTSSQPVIIGGTPSNPANVKGNGGVDAPVTFAGNSSTGTSGTESSIYFKQNVDVATSAVLIVNGNMTVEGYSNVSGRVHLGGAHIVRGTKIVWFNPLQSISFEGTPTNAAVLTGNGGVGGTIVLGAYAGLSAGNSPGAIDVAGDLLMGSSSFLEIDVTSTSDFDQLMIEGIFQRDGFLYVTLLNNFVPNSNVRFNFASHKNATGMFMSSSGSYGDVSGVVSYKASGFIYDDPQATSYCTCVLM